MNYNEINGRPFCDGRADGPKLERYYDAQPFLNPLLTMPTLSKPPISVVAAGLRLNTQAQSHEALEKFPFSQDYTSVFLR